MNSTAHLHSTSHSDTYALSAKKIQHPFCPEITPLTDSKVQRVANAIFCIVSVLCANFVYGLGGVIAIASIPLYLTAASFAVYFFQVKDYKNLELLKEYREAAISQGLEEVIVSHGLYNTIKHKILPPELFAEKLKQHLEKRENLSSVVKLYLEYKKIVKWSEFSPEEGSEAQQYRTLFISAINAGIGTNVVSCFESGLMPLLEEANLPSDELRTEYLTYQRAKKLYEDAQQQIYKEASETYWANIVFPFAEGYSLKTPRSRRIVIPKVAEAWVREVEADLVFIATGERNWPNEIIQRGSREDRAQYILQQRVKTRPFERIDQKLKLWEPPTPFNDHRELVEHLESLKQQVRVWRERLEQRIEEQSTRFKRSCNGIDRSFEP